MIVRKFLNWAQTASAGERAEGASALARAYLFADLSDQDFDDAELALTSLLDDVSPLVRRALAEAFASAEDAPHHLIATLAADQSDVSAPILSRSPLLSDVELVDLAAIGDCFAQAAIASRPALSAAVCAALAEVGARDALIALAANSAAQLGDAASRRMLERMGMEAELREALLARPDCSASLRYDLAQATAGALGAFASACGWLSDNRLQRLLGEARDCAALLAAQDRPDEAAALVTHLRLQKLLTPSLLLRSLLTGSTRLFAVALVELSAMPMVRVQGLLRAAQGSGFAALFARAGLPAGLLPAFQAALAAIEAQSHKKQAPGNLNAGPVGAGLSRPLIAAVMERCCAQADYNPQLLALLRRFEAEAAREVARQLTQTIVAEERHVASSQRVGLAAVAAALDVPVLFEDLTMDEYQVIDFAQAA